MVLNDISQHKTKDIQADPEQNEIGWISQKIFRDAGQSVPMFEDYLEPPYTSRHTRMQSRQHAIFP